MRKTGAKSHSVVGASSERDSSGVLAGVAENGAAAARCEHDRRVDDALALVELGPHAACCSRLAAALQPPRFIVRAMDGNDFIQSLFTSERHRQFEREVEKDRLAKLAAPRPLRNRLCSVTLHARALVRLQRRVQSDPRSIP